MNTRRVLCCSVDITGEIDFAQMLLNGDFSDIVYYNNKEIELSHIEQRGPYILGMFVTTQKDNIPPSHRPGDDEDYAEVNLGEGRGLAYPNVLVYDTNRNTIAWEVNRTGVTERTMDFFFNHILAETANIKLYPVVSANSFDRVGEMHGLKEFEFQIANPRAYLREQAQNETLAGISRVANALGASKAIKIIVKAHELDPVNPTIAQTIMSFYREVMPAPYKRATNTMKIVGYEMGDDGEIREEIINIMIDRLIGYFDIPRINPIANLQVRERQDGILNLYRHQLLASITSILG